MPKDWEGHKAELSQLYITENKTLLEIRDILRQRGFDASIRAYRMKFVDWKFSKYKPRVARDLSKHSHHGLTGPKKRKAVAPPDDNSETPRASPPLPINGTMPGGSDEETILPNALPSGSDYLLYFLGSGDGISGGNNIVSITNEDVYIARSVVEHDQHGETISIGGIEFPKQPKTPEELLTSIPSHKPNIRLYGILATWQSGNAYMECLNSFLNENSWNSLFSPCLYAPDEDGHLITIEDDLLSSSLFQVIARFVPSEDRFKVTKALLAQGPSEFSSFCKHLAEFVTLSKDFASEFAWIGFICGYFRQNGSDKVDEMCVAAGKVVIVERMLRHHKLILLDHESSLCDDCRSRDPQELRLEFMSILRSFSSVKSPELQLDVELYRYSLDVTEAIGRYDAVVGQKSLEHNLGLAKEKQEKYRKIIGKYTNTAPGHVDDQLDALLVTDYNFILEPPVAKMVPPSAFHLGSTDSVQAFSTSSSSSTSSLFATSNFFPVLTSPSLNPENPFLVPGNLAASRFSKSAEEYPYSRYQIDSFQLLFQEWTKNSQIRSYAVFMVFALFEELDFRALVACIARWVGQTSQMAFMKAIVECYMYFSAYNYPIRSGLPLELRYRLHDPVNRLPLWKKVKQFLLGRDAKHEKRPLQADTLTAYPECVLRLFGEQCLSYINSKTNAETTFNPRVLSQCYRAYGPIREDFRAWGFEVDSELVKSVEIIGLFNGLG